MNKLALLALLPTALSAQVLLTDDFNDSAINPALWTVSTPYADSSVTESSGYLQVQNRGRLTANQNFTSPYSITGSIQLSNNEFSNAKIVIRSDNGSIGAAEMGGIAIQFSVREDGGSYQNQLGIFTNGAPIESSASSFIDATLDLDTWYSFEIRDTGSEVSLYWNGSVSPTVALSTSYSIGSTIGFYNREGAAAGSGISNDGMARVDSFVVTVIPEPATYSTLIGIFVLGLVGMRRNRIS